MFTEFKLFRLLNKKSMTTKISNNRFLLILGSSLALLFIPLIAMQFSNQVDWKITDFLIMGLLLAGTSLLIELVLRKNKTFLKRIVWIGAALIGFLLIWAELAVGIFK